MFKKGSKLFGIINNKCPKCHEGDFYVDKNPLHLGKILTIHDKCDKCSLKYMLEPSFYHGAMYVSYGLSVATSIITFIICMLLGLELFTSFVIVIVSLILFTPVMLKLSRIIYINMFVSYDGKNLDSDNPKD
ncbi:MAG TPA: DUF983 domain-containing protein [Flavobacteriaceae bacterium]|nr:DUF983 domain-containing protein [Flavobacteriaceae bacterium]HIP26976.1 DUF983 domain-containing protein [Flavobacteriaceae bacterium]